MPPAPETRRSFTDRAAHAWARTKVGAARAGAWTQRRFQKGHAGRIAAWTAGGIAATFVGLLVVAGAIDWNAFKGPVARVASTMSGRPIAIDGDLDVKIWSLTPRVDVTGLRVGNPAWAQKEPNLANIKRASAEMDLLRTLTGNFTLNKLELAGGELNLLRAEPGKANWSTGSGTKPLKLPLIRHFLVKDGHVVYHDRRRGLTLDANFTSDEAVLGEAAASRRPFHLQGEGKFNGRVFKLDFVGAPLINVDRSKPYGFNADILAGPTRAHAEGALIRPFDFGAYNANLKVSGEDLADIYYLTGLALPNTPPYHLSGLLVRRRNGYDLTKIAGLIGDSDVHGNLHVDKRNDRPYLTGEAHTNSLDFDDLLTVLGAPPSVKKGETASPEQRAEAARLQANERLFPDAKLDIKRVRGMDAKVKYSADRVKAEGWPLRAFSVSINLDRGVLDLNPIALTLTQGKVAGSAKIDARKQTPTVDLDARLTGSRLENWIGVAMKDPPVRGPLSGRVQLHGYGDTVRKAAATANGRASFAAPRGEVREALAELTGINVIKGLGLLLSKDQSTVNVRCAVADFSVKNGHATSRTLVFDTEDVLITGSGGLNLDDETFDLSMKGQPKEPRLVRVRAPITIQGHFRAPKIGVKTENAIGQGGVGAALATLLSPLAAILPFIDAGLADDADCGALIAQAKAPKKAG